MKLSAAESKFLTDFGIPSEWVFDATGLPRQAYRDIMRASGQVLAAGVTPCNAAGHRLRTRAGHCVVCKPSNLLFLLRYHLTLQVYVARSMELELAKIGVAEDAEGRIQSLNAEGYACTDDWELHDWIYSKNAARVEARVATQFAASRVGLPWVKKGVPVTAFEVFDELPEVLFEAVVDADELINPS